MLSSHPASRARTPAVKPARSLLTLLLSGILVVSLGGCLGTAVESPSRSSATYTTLRVHLVAAPALIRADGCTAGLAEVTTYVPLWGLALGILTFGIVVPQWTVYSCAEGG